MTGGGHLLVDGRPRVRSNPFSIHRWREIRSPFGYRLGHHRPWHCSAAAYLRCHIIFYILVQLLLAQCLLVAQYNFSLRETRAAAVQLLSTTIIIITIIIIAAISLLLNHYVGRGGGGPAAQRWRGRVMECSCRLFQ